MGYPGYPQYGPPQQPPSRWPWILGILVVVAALMVGVIAAGIIIIGRERNSRANDASATVATTVVAGPGATAVVPPAATAPPADPSTQTVGSLRGQANADLPVVSATIADRWVPQISAKQPGLVATDFDGRMVNWTNSEILAQHQRLRQQFPGARLVWSNDWTTFDLDGWWITLGGASYSDPASANAWCDAHALSADDCFAKLVSNNRGSAGTTQYR
ncbi:hypothetical protein [Nocardia camponoti]|uniref:Uncharacterized protein n=1 Tax=Nocardia camponoti TaxID=1616106 RepID=A0A917V683_9NOCA|nr:hypothetical protein [Nocardia camponoti]GGK43398.1 hypothetical protein GCM10011591_13810 [Nocardia camponoti]